MSGHPSSGVGRNNPKNELTSAALIAMALKAASREASDDEDNNEGMYVIDIDKMLMYPWLKLDIILLWWRWLNEIDLCIIEVKTL